MSHLTFLQLDPTAAIAPSADLVVWSRMGGAYRPEQLTQALEQDRTLYEVRAYIRPTADLPLYLEAMAAWPYAKDDKRYSPPPGPVAQQWLEQNDSFRQDVLRRLRESGPLMSRDVPDTSVVPWQSSGWTGNRNVTQMLEFLNSRRRGRDRRPRRPAAAVGSRRARVPAREGRSRSRKRAGSRPSAGCAGSGSRGRR